MRSGRLGGAAVGPAIAHAERPLSPLLPTERFATHVR